MGWFPEDLPLFSDESLSCGRRRALGKLSGCQPSGGLAAIRTLKRALTEAGGFQIAAK